MVFSFGFRPAIFSSIPSLIWLLFYFYSKWRGQGSSASEKLLIIGVLSAPNNTLHRGALRGTWKQSLDERVDLKFIIGNEICGIPIVDRVTPESCEEWKPQLTNGAKVEVRHLMESTDDLVHLIGYTFLVKQNVTLSYLSLSDCLLTPDNQRGRVIVYDSFTGDTLTSATFIYDDSNSVNGILTKNIEPIKLNCSFEGELRVITSYNYNVSCGYQLTSPSALYILEGVNSHLDYIQFSSIEYRHITLAYLGFVVHDLDYWNHHYSQRLSRKSQWTQNIPRLKTSLAAEQSIHGDIIFVNVTDVYSSLSLKTLSFLKWATSQRYKYILKTDDDVFLNVDKIIDELIIDSDWDWWSCFRVGWPVSNSGKWRNRLLRSRIYPTFPSGAGYVIKSDTARRLLLSQPNLTAGAIGEDVAVGLLAMQFNMKPALKPACYWTCTKKPPNNYCNIPELSPNDLRREWARHLY